MFDNSRPLPHAILITTNEEKINYPWYDGHDKISKDVLVATIEDISSSQESVIFPKRVHEGDILLLHPFEQKKYIALEKITDLENAKFVRFTEIAQLLGAKEYSISSVKKQEYKQTLTANGKLGMRDKIDVNVNLKNKEDFKDKMGFELKDKFLGEYKADIEGYQKALSLVNNYNFEDEESLISLVKTRNPDNKNVHFSRTVKCDITQELNKTLDVAFTLTACSCFKFDTDIKKVLEERVEKSVEITFLFPENE